ncbi:MAG: DJ-1/PfpI family protein [Bacillota bacterium]|nr:DJ-1/PfpI family protein [Bacillota bacterium]
MFYVLLAEGFEEIEALTQVDILRRAKINVMTVGVTGKKVTGSHGIEVKSDISIKKALKAKDCEGVILPGGMPGTTNLKASKEAAFLIEEAANEGKMVAAICAAPSVLGKLGLLEGKKAVCFPGHEKELTGAELAAEPVVIDGNIITSRSAGTAHLFAFALVEYITGKSADNLKSSMLYI